MRISQAELVEAFEQQDNEAIGRLLLDLAGAIVGEHVTSRGLIDKFDSDDLQQELVLYMLPRLRNIHDPDRVSRFCYLTMARRLWQVIGRARAKHARRIQYEAEKRYRLSKPGRFIIGEKRKRRP